MLRIHLSIPRIALKPSALCIPQRQVRHGGTGSRRLKTPSSKIRPHTTEELKTDARFPLSTALQEYLNPKKLKENKAPRKAYANQTTHNPYHIRTQIVSPQLCDDTLAYLAPTLEKHKGCDILDLNPGAGLWSQKLHEFLQPRSHVLVEPMIERFETFLNPLLDAPDSKYKLCTKDPLRMDSFREMVDEDLFPHQKRLAAGDPNRHEPNNSLLVTGSFCWDPPLPGIGFDSMAKQMYVHLAGASAENDLFHAYGLARTLFWVPHDDFNAMIAEGASGMFRANRVHELSHTMDVVVTSSRRVRGRGRMGSSREPRMLIASDRRAIQAGRENGMVPPTHRRGTSYELSEGLEEHFAPDGNIANIPLMEYLWRRHISGRDTAGYISGHATLHYDQEIELRSKYPDLPFDTITDRTIPGEHVRGDKTQVKIPERKHLMSHPAYAEIKPFYKTRSGVVNVIKRKNVQESLAQMGEKMFKLEQKILRMEDGSEKDTEMEALRKLEARYLWGIEHEVGVNYQTTVLAETDDMVAFNMSPRPLLYFDRRPYPPLAMEPAESWPANRLALVSTEPDPAWARKDSEWRYWAEDFLYGLYDHSSDSLKEALDKLQHGLAGLIDHCPSLKDPNVGGRLLLDHLRVRMLTPPMIEELVSAYIEWPFKMPGSDHHKFFRSRNK